MRGYIHRAIVVVLLCSASAGCSCGAADISQGVANDVAPLEALHIGNDLAVQETSDGQVQFLFPTCDPVVIQGAELNVLDHGAESLWSLRQAGAAETVTETQIVAGQVPTGMSELAPYRAPVSSDQADMSVVASNGLFGVVYRTSDLADGKVHYQGRVLSESEFANRYRCGRPVTPGTRLP